LLLTNLQWARTFATKHNIYAHINASVICHLFMLIFLDIPCATLRHNVWVYIWCLCMCGVMLRSTYILIFISHIVTGTQR
jgi:hypothetical protein